MNDFKPMWAAIVGVVLFSTTGAHAQAMQPASVAQASTMTQQQLDEEILNQLKQIHGLLERLIAPPSAAVGPSTGKMGNLTNVRALGNPNAPLTMVEFVDLQCPYCRQYMETTFDQIKHNWIDTGQLRYISRDFPLDIHPEAMNAARAARCANEQGKFWEMHQSLMKNSSRLSKDYISKIAQDLGLDIQKFAACSASAKYDSDIQTEHTEGLRIGVEGTPSFLVGRTQPHSVEGPMVVGAMPYMVFEAKLRDLAAEVNANK